jgi:hypothetical protein
LIRGHFFPVALAKARIRKGDYPSIEPPRHTAGVGDQKAANQEQ